MISDNDRYFGTALSLILNGEMQPVTFRRAYSDIQGVYILQESLPLYIKYSKHLTSPWTFNFHYKHQKLYQLLVDNFGDCISAFVCGTDGVVALDHELLRQVLDNYFEEQESVTIRRKRREMYSVKGRDGELNKKIGRSSLNDMIKDKLGQGKI